MENTKRQALFTIAHTDLKGMPFNNHGRTLRLVVECNIEAEGVSVLLSNRCGTEPLVVGAASLAPCDEHGTQKPGTLVPITVNGVLDFLLEPGEEVYSDEVRFPLMPGEYFALNLYYPTDTPVTSGNWLGNTSYRSKAGNYSSELSLGRPRLVNRLARTVMVADLTVPLTTVRRIVAHTHSPGRVVACFGDSITQQSSWTAPLQKLLYHRWPGDITLVNLGISGNRLLRDGPEDSAYGEAGMTRFEHDLYEVEGLTHAIIELGTNDLGHPGDKGIPESDMPTLEEYTLTMTWLARKLHDKGVKVYAATLCPRIITDVFTNEREELRHVYNEWIRTAPCFDAVLDFDAWTRKADGTPGMRDKYVLPDGLHPTQYGGLRMAKKIDLDLFAPEGDSETEGDGGNGTAEAQ